MDNTNNDHLTNYETYGYVMAELYQAFVKWVEKNREYPAKVSMRSGHPIMHAVKWLGERGQVKSDEWSEAWVNKTALEAAAIYIKYNKKTPTTSLENFTEYIQQERLDKPFSLVDNGYNGTITRVLEDCFGNKEMQTLFLLGAAESCSNTKKSIFIRPFISIIQDHLCHIIEKMPQNFCEYMISNYKKNENGKVFLDTEKKKDIDSDCFKAYQKGMTEGFTDCFAAVQSKDKDQFEKYIKSLCNRDTNFIKLSTLSSDYKSGETRERFLQHKEKIKEIYQKG